MRDAGELVGVRLLDHFILGSAGRWVSLKQRGAC
ncbi:MAG TPA: JAB domain-containing protein [Thermoanaerobaculia bacterium]|nr:JAB domain-containing protein [Thermoanaerobaculia bacterium]